MWFEYKEKPVRSYDADRRVTLTIGQLTDAIAKALEVVEDAPPEPKWMRGDRAFVEVLVTAVEGDNVSIVASGYRSNGSITIPARALVEITHAS